MSAKIFLLLVPTAHAGQIGIHMAAFVGTARRREQEKNGAYVVKPGG